MADRERPTTPCTGSPVLDEMTLESLENSIEAGALQHIIGLFLEDTGQRLRLMQDAYGRRDWQRLRQEAHVLKSATATFGIIGAWFPAQQLDQACQEGCLPRIQAHLACLAELLPPALTALDRRYRNES